MDWYTTSVLAAQRQAELARDAALVRAGRAARTRKARKDVDDRQVKGDLTAKEQARRRLKVSDSSASGSVCRRCGSPVDHQGGALSRHRTSDGTVVYTRCACGLLQVWLTDELTAARLVTRARDTEAEVGNELAVGL